MAIIQPPVPIPMRRTQWRRKRAQQKNRSGWTGTSQIVRLPQASIWTVSGEFPPIIKEENSLEWQAFFEAVDGMANSFPVLMCESQQTSAANVQVNGGGQTGSSVALKGLTGAIGSKFLLKGQKISIPLPNDDVQLEVLQQDITVLSGGVGTALFAGTLRKSPIDSATVEVQWPYALMSMTSPETGFDVNTGQNYGFAFEAEEAF
ncbi:MAG: hypothetical protein ABJP02_04865 [Parasphingorhabdus sp.]|uniref:hypothetical protein n=1 Tax=Parasphingorhabdus sp. TaxID=2709688 RepID=UPI003298D46B